MSRETPLGRLIQNQWRERSVSLGVCAVWIVCCVGYALLYEFSHRYRDPIATFYTSCLLYTMFAGIFLAMRTAVAERTQGTLSFSLALPVSRRSLASVRLAGGLVTLVAPILLGAILFTPLLGSGLIEQAALREESYVRLLHRPSLEAAEAVGLLWTVTVVAIASGVQFVLLLSVFGARRTSESHIGILGVLVATVWMLPIGWGVLNGWIGAVLPSSLIMPAGYGTIDGGSYTDLVFSRSPWLPLLVNLAVLGLLAWCFVARYGTSRLAVASKAGRACRLRPPGIASRIPIPNRTAALVWINLRQSIPLACSGLLLAAVFALTTHGYDETFRSALPANMWWVALLWSTVVGAGVFAAEVRPDLAAFWRSRPIPVSTWYWFKFAVGLFAVLAVLDGVAIAVGWGTPIGDTTGLSWSYIACMPVLHALLYSLTVLAVCWLRRPVAAAMLALVTDFMFSRIVPAIGGSFLEPINIHNALLSDEIDGQLNFFDHGYPLVYGAMATGVVVCSVLAARVIRRPQAQ